ncbi:MAG: hypothetical protein M3Q50_13885 [Chloroflexota bacterium]|nr:hypothetical protein [Chloroflexia bacterium]MDQ3227707.1 hypothetical protein [Chloroflexota bacterium]
MPARIGRPTIRDRSISGTLLDIELRDHLIFGEGRWISLKRLGLGFPKA